jgi:hypothetical protein
MERSPELAINYFVETCLAIDSFSGQERGVLDCFPVPASLLQDCEDLNFELPPIVGNCLTKDNADFTNHSLLYKI